MWLLTAIAGLKTNTHSSFVDKTGACQRVLWTNPHIGGEKNHKRQTCIWLFLFSLSCFHVNTPSTSNCFFKAHNSHPAYPFLFFFLFGNSCFKTWFQIYSSKFFVFSVWSAHVTLNSYKLKSGRSIIAHFFFKCYGRKTENTLNTLIHSACTTISPMLSNIPQFDVLTIKLPSIPFTFSPSNLLATHLHLQVPCTIPVGTYTHLVVIP